MNNNQVFCVSDNDSGYFPAMYANQEWWQKQSGFRPAEEPKKPEPIAAPTTEPTKKTKK